MSTAATANPPPKTAEERLEVILSNQYKRRMHRNRPKWYSGNPLDTAPKCFAPWRRNDVPLIRDWETCRRVVAKKAAWMGKVFEDKYYEINGVIWGWQDPASNFLVDLFTSEMETVEFAISSDPFWVPHIIVTHSPGDEPQYLDTHANPDQLTKAPRGTVPNPWGCTPRQSFTGPTGKDQLLLPPRMSASHEREEYVILCTMATINRHGAIVRLSVKFQSGLRRIRARRGLFRAAGYTPDHDEIPERGRELSRKDISNSHLIPSAEAEESDFVPMSSEEVQASGFSDEDAAKSLLERCGIMFQMQLDDIGDLADSAVLSGNEDEDEDDEDEDKEEEEVSSPSLPHSPTIASDTYKALRKLGMVYCEDEEDEEEGGDEDEDEGSEDEGNEEEEDMGDDSSEEEDEGEDGDEEEEEDEDEDQDQDYMGDNTLVQDSGLPGTKGNTPEPMSSQSDLTSRLLEAGPTAFPTSDGSLDLASILLKDADEEHSSVSSLFVEEDRDSIASGIETPDTEDDC